MEYRHTFGSHLAQKGVSFYKISEMMGNSPEICRKHYAALTPQEMHDEVEF
jgi:site-specific recombinase XerD